MATTINADTIIGGYIVTADTSGQLELQSAGVTKLTVNSAGVALTSALLAASGGTGLTSPGTSGNVLTSNGTTWVSQSVPASPTLTGTGASGTWNISITGNAATATTLSIIPGTAGNVLTSNGSAWVSQATSSPVTYATIIKFQ